MHILGHWRGLKKEEAGKESCLGLGLFTPQASQRGGKRQELDGAVFAGHSSLAEHTELVNQPANCRSGGWVIPCLENKTGGLEGKTGKSGRLAGARLKNRLWSSAVK